MPVNILNNSPHMWSPPPAPAEAMLILRQIAQNSHPIDLRTAHQNHRHRPPAPHPIRKPGRVTSRSGPTVTSLSGVYISDSHKVYYGTFSDLTIRPARKPCCED